MLDKYIIFYDIWLEKRKNILCNENRYKRITVKQQKNKKWKNDGLTGYLEHWIENLNRRTVIFLYLNRLRKTAMYLKNCEKWKRKGNLQAVYIKNERRTS